MAIALKVVVRPRDFTRVRRGLGKLRLPGAIPIYKRALTRSVERGAAITRQDFLSGQSLRVRSGKLRRSIVVDLSGLRNSGRMYAEFGSDAAIARYGGPHEFGWPGKNIRARPFIQPGLAKLERELPAIWIEEMERELGRVR